MKCSLYKWMEDDQGGDDTYCLAIQRRCQCAATYETCELPEMFNAGEEDLEKFRHRQEIERSIAKEEPYFLGRGKKPIGLKGYGLV